MSVQIAWLVSRYKGGVCHTFVKPEVKAERILAMTILGHENISEPFFGHELGYMGQYVD
jgi:hypothetical protein